uniref:Rhodanese domain-containing protein n=1 Tax=Mesocestoides corti TaxID=53468 RepID=A0A5K3ESN2_MESCO
MPATRKKPIDPLQKRIPKNPRYNDVIPTVDTGASLSSYLKKLDDASENFKIKQGEIFRRMKMTTFVQLLIQVAEVNGIGTQNGQDDESGVTDEKAQVSEGRTSVDPPSCALMSSRPTLESVIKGIGELDMNQKNQSCLQPLSGIIDTMDRPYLLLDVREKDEFDQCHIIQALSYPHTMLSRCMSFETREMLAYRNKPGHIIICYDEDERLAPRVATILTERGYENVFVLSGGLKVAWKLFPKGLILGDAPLTLKAKPGKRPKHEKNILRLSSISSPSVCNSLDEDGASSVRKSTAGSHSIASSSRRAIKYTFDTYEAVGSRGTPNGGEEFTMLDLTHLSLALDSFHASGGRSTTARTTSTRPGSARSRMSRASTLKALK